MTYARRLTPNRRSYAPRVTSRYGLKRYPDSLTEVFECPKSVIAKLLREQMSHAWESLPAVLVILAGDQSDIGGLYGDADPLAYCPAR